MTNWESSTSMMLILPLKSKGPLNAPYRALLRGNAGRKLGRNLHGEANLIKMSAVSPEWRRQRLCKGGTGGTIAISSHVERQIDNGRILNGCSHSYYRSIVCCTFGRVIRRRMANYSLFQYDSAFLIRVNVPSTSQISLPFIV